MFTKNWYYSMAAGLHADSISITTTMYPNVKNMSGVSPNSLTQLYYWSRYLSNKSDMYAYPSIYKLQTSLGGYGGVIIGTGTTPPTIEDYKLSGDMITTFTYQSAVSATTDSTGMNLTALYTITNTGSEPFTIGEIGLVAASYNTSSTSYKCLLERTVLDSPVTIPAGGVGQVTYTIRMNYPT